MTLSILKKANESKNSPSQARGHWESMLTTAIHNELLCDAYWQHQFALPDVTVHLAILVEPYLQYVLNGSKTVESRFSVNRCAPYLRVSKGDIVLLKRAGGDIFGLCLVTEAWFYHLDHSSWSEIKGNFAQALCAQDPEFWEKRSRAAFATLMRIGHPTILPRPISCEKRDRRGWVILSSGKPHRHRQLVSGANP